MKYFIYILLGLVVVSCGNETAIKTFEKPNTDSLKTDSILTFSYKNNISDVNISNSSDRKIDILFNSLKHYLGRQKKDRINFRVECLTCQPIKEYKGGLLFAKRFFITQDQIQFFKNDLNISDDSKSIELYTERQEKTNPKFQFSAGKCSIKFQGISCNDAVFNKVKLSYPTGTIIVDSLINADFFEYDLNKDGQMEQYLFGARNCSQEIVFLRIRKPKDY